MMKRMKRYVLAMIVIILVAGSCYKDKGNYTYGNLAEFAIDTLSTPREFVVSQYATLQVKPKVTYNGDASNLEFTWSAYLKDSPSSGNNRADTLSVNQYLADPINFLPDSYFLEYSVREKSSGRKVVYRYQMRVEGMGSGLMVLYSRNHLTDLDLIKTPLLDGGLTQGEISRNIYSKANPEHPLEGDAVGISSLKTGDQGWISVMSEQDGVTVSSVDMAIVKPFNKLFTLAPKTVKPESVYSLTGIVSPPNSSTTDGAEFLVNDGKVYANMALFSFGQESNYSILLAGDGDYLAAPFVRYGFGRIVVFDQLKGRFLSSNPIFLGLNPLIGSPDVAEFDFQHIPDNLLYLDYGYGGGLGQYVQYAVFADKNNTAKKLLYIMNFGTRIDAMARWDLTGLIGIANSSYYSFATRAPIVYYADKSNVYQLHYDWIAGTVSGGSLAWDGLPVGEEITGIKFCKFPGRAVSENTQDKYLFVSTYNASTAEGKLYVLSVNLASGELGKIPVVTYGGFGKIKDITFKY